MTSEPLGETSESELGKVPGATNVLGVGLSAVNCATRVKMHIKISSSNYLLSAKRTPMYV